MIISDNPLPYKQGSHLDWWITATFTTSWHQSHYLELAMIFGKQDDWQDHLTDFVMPTWLTFWDGGHRDPLRSSSQFWSCRDNSHSQQKVLTTGNGHDKKCFTRTNCYSEESEIVCSLSLYPSVSIAKAKLKYSDDTSDMTTYLPWSVGVVITIFTSLPLIDGYHLSDILTEDIIKLTSYSDLYKTIIQRWPSGMMTVCGHGGDIIATSYLEPHTTRIGSN